MNLPVHLFSPKSPNGGQLAETISFPSAIDVTWNRPVFRAPALPMLLPIGDEIPFTSHLPVKFAPRKPSA